VTAALCALSFIAFTSAVVCGLEAIVDDDRHDLLLRAAAALAAGAALASWTFVRLRAARDVDQAPAPPAVPRPARPRARKRWLRRAGWLVAVAIIGAGAASVAGEWDAAQAALGHLAHLRWIPVRWAIYAEALSVLSVALAMGILLRAARRPLGVSSAVGITLASNAMASSAPAGAAWAATFSFDQLRRRGVSRRVAVWVLALNLALSVLALMALLLIGTIVAGGRGPAATMWPFVVGLAVVALLCLVLIVRRPRVRRWLARLTGVRYPRRLLATAFAAAVLNWLADCACLAASIAAVSGHVPWRGLLAIYAATQVAQALPFTPGGLGVVEGAASLLLIGYGMPTGTAVAGVLLYRIISFWVLLPIGWGAAGGLLLAARRGYGRRRRYAPIRVSSSGGLARSYEGSSSA
jgi:uncharacterized membrane protein YbhN (UPF0104 family)